MKQQFLPLGDPPVRSNAPDTSHEAAESMKPHHSRLANDCLAYIKLEGDATCWEIEQALEMSHQTASARLWELRRAGVIQDTGRRRKTGSGRSAIVWGPKADVVS